MRISDVIQHKGSDVITAAATDSVEHLVALLADNAVGAAVVIDEALGVIGIASERDVVKALRVFGDQALSKTIADVMSAPVQTCDPGDDIGGVAGLMTQLRVRHIPVVVAGNLAGIVSIGDIVKSRIDELQAEQEHLVNYLQG